MQKVLHADGCFAPLWEVPVPTADISGGPEVGPSPLYSAHKNMEEKQNVHQSVN